MAFFFIMFDKYFSASAISVPLLSGLKSISSRIILRICLFPFFGGIYFSTLSEKNKTPTEIQKKIKERNADAKTEFKLEYRIGINMGDVVKQGPKNLMGDCVNIAARLESLAQPGGITISKNIYDLVVNKTKYQFNDLGEQKVKDNKFHA